MPRPSLVLIPHLNVENNCPKPSQQAFTYTLKNPFPQFDNAQIDGALFRKWLPLKKTNDKEESK